MDAKLLWWALINNMNTSFKIHCYIQAIKYEHGPMIANLSKNKIWPRNDWLTVMIWYFQMVSNLSAVISLLIINVFKFEIYKTIKPQKIPMIIFPCHFFDQIDSINNFRTNLKYLMIFLNWAKKKIIPNLGHFLYL